MDENEPKCMASKLELTVNGRAQPTANVKQQSQFRGDGN
jgi:hypothetical protein